MSGPRNRHLRAGICFLSAVVLLTCGWLMPVYLKGVDIAVIRSAGRMHPVATPSPDVSTPLGMGDDLVTSSLMQRTIRAAALGQLANSPQPAVRELLRSRALTDTVLMPASGSAAGQAFDGAVAICGLLIDGGHLAPALRDQILARAQRANRGYGTQPLEDILIDELSLGQRMDWRQLAVFNGRIEDAATLDVLADAMRDAGAQSAVIRTAVEMSQQPAGVARYLQNFGPSALNDLATSELSGAGSVDELLRRGQRLYISPIRQNVVSRVPFSWFFRAGTGYALRMPGLALALKWLFYFSGGIFLVLSLRHLQKFPYFSPGREALFASAVLLAALLVGEPFLGGENPAVTNPFRLHLSLDGAAAIQIHHPTLSMNTSNMTANFLTLLLFFVLQALIYFACIARLRDTLRQNIPARVKLKLLENEEHLFDAGLYLGFVGTIICLILVSLGGLVQFSLMAAYSSTSFGIIFVSVLKIFKVRPAKRRLLLEAEEENASAVEPRARTVAPTLATQP